MRKERLARREQYIRGGAPKASLILTGIQTFLVLIAAAIFFILRFTTQSGAESLVDSTDNSTSTLDSIVSIFGAGLEEMASAFLMIIAIVLLVVGIWYLIFWIICMKSKCRKTRQVVCTVLGRLPGLIIIIMILSVGSFGLIFLIVFVWIVLNILLSAVGWKDNKSAGKR